MPDKKIIVIIGGGILQVPLIKASCKRRFRTIVIDGNREAPGRNLTPDFIQADISAADITLASLQRYLREKPDGVLTVGTDFTYTVALINEYYELKGVSIPTAQKATDKVLMRQAFKEAGVAQPNFTFFETKDLSNIINHKEKSVLKLKWPLVVKPADSMGSRGGRQISHHSELKEAIKFAATYSKKNKIIIEEYIDGDEFSIDALINNGKIHIHGLADRIISPPPFFCRMGTCYAHTSFFR